MIDTCPDRELGWHWELGALRSAVVRTLAGWRGLAPAGRLRLTFVAPPALVRGGFDLAESADGFDEIYLRDLVAQAEAVGTPGVVIALCRPDGRPLRRDRTLRRLLALRMATSPVLLADFLIVGPDRESPLPARRCQGAPARKLR